jgi:hypothetical protein
MAIATAAKQIIHDGMDVTIGAGLESISLVQNEHINTYMAVIKTLQECIKIFTCQCYKQQKLLQHVMILAVNVKTCAL